MTTSESNDASAAGITNEDTLTATLNTALGEALGAADTLATEGVATLSLVHQARLAQLTRSAAAITKAYGAKSQRAANAQEAVSAQQTTAARIAAVSRQTATPAPQVTANGWALYGRVFSSTMEPRQGYCVFFVDSSNAYQGTYGFSYTDSTGYFQIDYAPAAAQGTTRQQQSRAKAAAGSASALFVEVTNDKAHPVLISQTPFQPMTGLATYQDITLPEGEAPLGDTPVDVKKGAEPGK